MKSPLCRISIVLALFSAGLLAGRFLPREKWTALADCVDAPEYGNVNGDGFVDISDPVYMLRHLFQGGPPPQDCRSEPDPVSVALVVRHANRDPGIDELNEEGWKRAFHLADILADKEIDHLIASEKTRTKQTLQPTAAANDDMEIEELDDRDIEGIARRILDAPQGSFSVVAGHSYSVHDILIELGVDKTIATEESIPVSVEHYSQFLMVLLPADGPAQLVHLHY